MWAQPYLHPLSLFHSSRRHLWSAGPKHSLVGGQPCPHWELFVSNYISSPTPGKISCYRGSSGWTVASLFKFLPQVGGWDDSIKCSLCTLCVWEAIGVHQTGGTVTGHPGKIVLLPLYLFARIKPCVLPTLSKFPRIESSELKGLIVAGQAGARHGQHGVKDERMDEQKGDVAGGGLKWAFILTHRHSVMAFQRFKTA